MDFSTIRKSIIDEANISPNMLSDIAGLETYISESYNNRAFIELLQNADDAKSTTFLIKKIGDYLLVANNGKIFDELDLISLCRSASSIKKRGKSIGYRGIGFKSVVNFANEVHIISGEMMVTFSRELTKAAIKSTTCVPLIRIPHAIRQEILSEVEKIIFELKKEGYTTFFIFTGLVIDRIEDDYKKLNNSSLLFLNNIREVKNELIGSVIRINNKPFEKGYEIDIFDSDELLSSWLLYGKQHTNIAFIKTNKIVSTLPRTEALIYSFLPTEDFSGLGVLINSDFSTDPSRRHLIKDDTTKESIREICELYTEIFLENIFSNNINSQAIIKSLAPYSEPSLIQFTGNYFEKTFISEIRNVLELTNILFRPSWLNSRDFNLITQKMNCKSIDIDYGNSTLYTYLKYLGAKELLIDDIDSKDIINSLDLTLSGCIQITSRLIKQSLLNIGSRKSNLIYLKLFYCNNEKKALSDINENNEFIDESYLYSLIDTGLTKNDLKSIFKKNNLSNLLLHLSKKNIIENKDDIYNIKIPNDEIENEYVNELRDELQTHSFENWYKKIKSSENFQKYERALIPKWRSAEQQVLYILNKNGFHLSDVSKQNLGYDLEGRDPYGANVYIEVKSISYPGQSFKMSNNEYATAQLKGNSYLIAIAYIVDNQLQLMLFPNPANQLKLNRQCIQWAWECCDYNFQPQTFCIR